MTVGEKLFEYVDGVLSGKTVSGQKVKKAVVRFVEDLNSDEFYFDTDELRRLDNWRSLFLFTKGLKANEPIEFAGFQLFILANLFCLKRKSTKRRKYTKAYIQVARKNGKSWLLAFIASYTAFLSKELEEIYVGATKREQAQIVLTETLNMVRRAPMLKGKFEDSYGRLTVKKNGSVMKALSREDGKRGDGLMASLAILDETHAMETSELYDVLHSGMIGRENPLTVAISTAGLNPTYWGKTEYDYADQVINGHLEVDSYFVFLAELDEGDDWRSKETILKANPLYQEALPEALEDLYLRQREAQLVPDKEYEFRVKHLNEWMSLSEQGYIDLEKYDAQTSDTVLSDLLAKSSTFTPNEERIAYVGLDLSSTLDLTAASIIVPGKTEGFFVKTLFFLPEDRLNENEDTDKVPYSSWHQQGFLHLTPGNVVDYSYVKQVLLDVVEQAGFTIEEIGIDPWGSASLQRMLFEEGLSVIQVNQWLRTLAPPTKAIRDRLYEGKMIFEENPVMRWNFANCKLRYDDNMNFTISKKVSRQKIDGVAALITGFSLAMYHFEKGETIEIDEDYLKKLGW